MNNTGRNLVTFGIVEDEIIESEAMIYFINMMFPQANVIWHKQDGLSALNAIHQNPPDVVIIDIQMPVMDGLQLCEHLYQENYEGVILINTAYNKFSYAKKAIQLKAFDYIVKPVDNDELFDAVSRCVSEAERRKMHNNKQNEFIKIIQNIGQNAFSIMGQNSSEKSKIPKLFESIGWPAHGKYCAYVLHIVKKEHFSNEEVHVLQDFQKLFPIDVFISASEFFDDRHLILVVQPRVDIPLSKWHTLIWCYSLLVLQRIKNSAAHISSLCKDIYMVAEECRYTYQDPNLPECRSDRINMPTRTWRIIVKKDTEKYINTFQRYFRDGSFERVQKLVADFINLYENDLLDAFWEIVQILICSASHVWIDQSFKSVIIPLFQADVDYLEWLKNFFSFCSKLPNPQTGDSIDAIIKFMETSFSENITQAIAAEKMGMDPSYFSRLFKKRTGRKFSEMLTDFRMQHAEKMLTENPNCSLEELCEGCGLSSTTYFSEVFKKWKGMTITQFLKSQ